MDTLEKYLREEFLEHLKELSKHTLKQYIKKASGDVATKSAATGRYGERANVAYQKSKKGDHSDYAQGKRADDFANQTFKKSWKRRTGIAKAVDKLEEENLVELKKSTLKNYVKKARKSYDDAADMAKSMSVPYSQYDTDSRVRDPERNKYMGKLHNIQRKRLYGMSDARTKIKKGTKAEKK